MQVFKFRGIDNCCIAEVVQDTNEAITFGEVIPLFPIGEVGKTTGSDSATDFADNKAMIIINSEGADEISLTGFGVSLENLARITGKTFDESKGVFIDTVREVKYWALLYREKLTNGRYRYVVRYKGTFAIPDEGSATENDGTDSLGQSLAYTGIFTQHEFTNGGSAKGIVIDTQYEGANPEDFFTTVVTPDTVTAKA